MSSIIIANDDVGKYKCDDFVRERRIGRYHLKGRVERLIKYVNNNFLAR